MVNRHISPEPESTVAAPETIPHSSDLTPTASSTVPSQCAPGTSAKTDSESPVPTHVLVWLDPRDPFSLLAHWDAEEASVQRFCATFPGDALRLRVYARQVGGVLMSDQIVIPTARHRLVPVLYANTPYVAELGFVDFAGIWRSLATSPKIQTPPDHHVEEWTERRGRFQARPSHPPQPAPVSTPDPEPAHTTHSTLSAAPANAQESLPPPADSESLMGSLPPLPDEPAAQFLTTLVWEPAPVIVPAGSSVEMAQWVAKVVTTPWSPARSPALPSSPDWTGLTPEQPELPGVPGSIPTPAPAPSNFWFKVNAELIIYGSTEPDAQVTLGGKPVRLREDGSFSFRFSLPDGDYELPAQAVKADGSDQRSARLQFQRKTTRQGDVGTHPTDPLWKPPVPESLP